MTVSTDLPTHFTLNTGAKIPVVGLGTWKSEPGEVRQAVSHAIRDGWRHIDAALIYQNEHEVGQGIRDSGVPREELFITSKLWNTHQANVAEGLRKSLDALGTDYLDLYASLVHWPVRLVANETSELLPVNPDGTRSVDRSWDQAETWRQMEELLKTGKFKAIGLANWSIPYLEELKKTWKVMPAVNQVELHPFLPQHALRRYCDDLGILLQAYSPLGSTGAPLMSDPKIAAIAKKNGVAPATVLISCHALHIVLLFAPESPWWLIRKGRVEEAARVVKRLGKIPGENTQAYVAMMGRTSEIEQRVTAGASYAECFKGPALRRTLIVCCTHAFANFTGLLVSNLGTYFFLVAGLSEDQAYGLGLGNTGIQLTCVILSVGLSSRFGRRTLVMWGLGFNCLCLLLMGILACLKQSTGVTWAQGILVIIIGAQWGLTLGPMCWTIVGETSSLRLRALTVGLSRDAYYLSSVVLGITRFT